MANRRDFNSKLPRQIKRRLALNYIDPHRRGEIRRLFLDAHAHEKEAVKKRLTAKNNVDFPEETPTDASVAATV